MNAQADAELRIEEIDRELDELKAKEKEIKAAISAAGSHRETEFKKMRLVARDFADVRRGQALMPFESMMAQLDGGPDGDPDVNEGTPALEALAKILFEARENMKGSDVGVLVAYGLTEAAIQSIREELSVSTVGELAESMKGDWSVKGFGKSKKEKLRTAVTRYLMNLDKDGRPMDLAGAPKGKGPSAEADDRVRVCLSCHAERDQSETVCECGETTFELAEPSATEGGGEQMVIDGLRSEERTLSSGLSVTASAGEVDSAWYCAFNYVGASEAGSDAPLVGSQPYSSYEEAIHAAYADAARDMLAQEMDDDASELREMAAELMETA